MESCRPSRNVIAQGPICQIEECTCGVLHLTIGALTLRLQEEVVASLSDTLAEALTRLAVKRATIESQALLGGRPS